MKINYIKSWDDDGYVITQTITPENDNEKELLKDFGLITVNNKKIIKYGAHNLMQ